MEGSRILVPPLQSSKCLLHSFPGRSTKKIPGQQTTSSFIAPLFNNETVLGQERQHEQGRWFLLSFGKVSQPQQRFVNCQGQSVILIKYILLLFNSVRKKISLLTTYKMQQGIQKQYYLKVMLPSQVFSPIIYFLLCINIPI